MTVLRASSTCLCTPENMRETRHHVHHEMPIHSGNYRKEQVLPGDPPHHMSPMLRSLFPTPACHSAALWSIVCLPPIVVPIPTVPGASPAVGSPDKQEAWCSVLQGHMLPSEAFCSSEQSLRSWQRLVSPTCSSHAADPPSASCPPLACSAVLSHLTAANASKEDPIRCSARI